MRLILLILALSLIALVSCFEIVSPDLFWHLKMGQDFWVSGLSPFIDHYSFTFYNVPIKMVTWPFDVIIFWFYSLGGIAGIAIYRFLVWGTGFGLLLLILKRQNIRPAIQILGVLFFLFILVYHSEPRPDLLSLTLEFLTITICFWWRRTESFKAVAALSLLFIFWSNYHVSSVFGYVIVGAFMIERLEILVWKKEQVRSWIRFGLSVFLINLAGFLNHDLRHPILSQGALSPKWANYIVEYMTRPYATEELYLEIYWILLGVTLPALVFKKEWAGLIISLVIGYKAWSMSKLFPHLVVLTVPFVCLGFNYYFDVILKRQMTMVRNFLFILGGGVFSVLVWQLLNVTVFKPLHPVALRISSSFFPVDTVNYFKLKNFRGRILNEYALGGYILFNLAPESTVYIDGRTSILYPLDLMERYTHLLTNVEPLKIETQKYKVDWVIGSLEKPDELIDTALGSGDYAIEYMGKNSALLSHNFKMFPLASVSILHPQCLDSADAAEVRREYDLAHVLLPLESPLVTFLELSDRYFSVKDKSSVFNLADNSVINHTITMRLAAYLAQKEKRGDLALFYYNHIPHPSQDDKINGAEVDCEFNACRNAEAILNTVTMSGLRIDHIYRAYKLLERIKNQIGLKIFTEERLERDKAKINGYRPIGVGLRCHPINKEQVTL